MENNGAIRPAGTSFPYGKCFCHLQAPKPDIDMMLKTICAIGIAFLTGQHSFGQGAQEWQAKVATSERLAMEYMDFGGDGIPLVVVQGAHNYFDTSSAEPFIKKSNETWIGFFTSFTDKYHVLAPLRRGFGRSDNQLDSYTVQTETKDLVSWMDAVGIEKAIFMGRDVAAREMLHMAEAYPERVIAIAFIEPLFVFPDVRDTLTAEYIYYDMRQSYSASEFKDFRFSEDKNLYRPRIFRDESIRIEIPALLFYHSRYSHRTLAMGRIERFIGWVEKNPDIEWEQYYHSDAIRTYFKNLATDRERMEHIRKYLDEENPTTLMQAALRRAFGDHLVVFNETRFELGYPEETLMQMYAPVTNNFFSLVSRTLGNQTQQ